MPAKGESSSAALLENPKVRSWYDGRSLKSRLSADTDLRKLRLILERLKLDPESIVSVAAKDPDRLQDMLIQYAAEMKRAGLLDDYIAKTLSGLKNYLKFRRVQFSGFPTLSPIHSSSLANERVPTPDELGAVLERLSLRGRTIALLMAHTGVRPQVIGSYTGDRGLTLGDLPELDIPSLTFSEVPFVIRVPADLSKTRVSFTTFGTRQLSLVIVAYLSERKAAGERLSAASPVVAPTRGDALRGVARESREEVAKGRRFLVTGVLVQEVRAGLRAVVPKGTTWRPIVCRSYFSTRLLMSPMNRDLREALMAHRTISLTYNLGKKWGPELLAQARREYARASEFLETNLSKSDDKTGAFIRLVLQANGIPDKDIDALGDITPEKAIEVLREAGVGRRATAVPIPPTRIGEQKLVPAADLEAWLGAGWSAKFALGADRVMLEGVGVPVRRE